MAWQSQTGFRAGVDTVLLAACVPAKPGDRVLDMGCGAGVASLCVQARVSGAECLGVEREPIYAQIARDNGIEVEEADVLALPKALKEQQFDHVLANPPYYAPQSRMASPDPKREVALAETGDLSAWIEVASKRCAPKGSVSFVQKAARLPDLLPAFAAHLGDVVVQPYAPRSGRPAHLVVVQGWRGTRGPFRLNAPIILHSGMRHTDDGEDYTEAMQQILRNGRAIDLCR
ncbi:MAG: methyltransferase [Pseudomonadota bacterium]